MMKSSNDIKNEILQLVSDYYDISFGNTKFIPGETPIPVAGRTFDANEIQMLVNSALEFWLTAGHFAEQFEKEFSQNIGIREAILVNSGSSANLLSISALTSSELRERALQSGDEIITVAASFPTTINPILQNGSIPVFVDISIPTYNINPHYLEQALSPRTKAIIVAHTLGNPFEVEVVKNFAIEHNLWLIEDCCDALGAKYKNKTVGTFGDLATFSFYPAHHITMGEGGCIITHSIKLRKLIESFRDWGRDCWCLPGIDNTCGKRFDWRLGDLPENYDHKYIYSHIGYNLKATEMQAAIGIAQLKKLKYFSTIRQNNFEHLYNGLQDLEEFFILPIATQDSQPSWFGFPLAIKKSAHFSRDVLVRYLNENHIGTRLLFAGNIIKQPAYRNQNFRIASSLENTDFVMENVFWIGVYPGITDEMINFMLDKIHDFCKK